MILSLVGKGSVSPLGWEDQTAMSYTSLLEKFSFPSNTVSVWLVERIPDQFTELGAAPFILQLIVAAVRGVLPKFFISGCRAVDPGAKGICGLMIETMPASF